MIFGRPVEPPEQIAFPGWGTTSAGAGPPASPYIVRTVT